MQTAAQRGAWREFLRLAAFRYGPGGTFWSENSLLPERPGQIKRAYFAADFLERMYRTTPGVRGKFIAVALHPYSYSYKDLTAEIEEVRAALKREHDPGRALWLTELGWSSGVPTPPTVGTDSRRGRRDRRTN